MSSSRTYRFSQLRTLLGLPATGPLRASTVIIASGGTASKGSNLKLSIPKTQLSSVLPATPKINCQAKSLTLNNGDGVSSWGGAFTQATIDRRPIFRTSGGINNGKCIEFSRASLQYLYSSSPVILNGNTNGGITYGILLQLNESSVEENIISCNLTTNRFGEYYRMVKWADNRTSYITTDTKPFRIDFTLDATPNFTPGSWHAFVVRYNNATTTYTVWRDNVVVTNRFRFNIQTGIMPNTSLNIALGNSILGQTNIAATTQTNAFNGKIGAYIVYDRALSDAEVSNLTNYLLNGGAT